MANPALRLRELRELKGWTQSELANAIGTTQVTVSRLESGVKPRADVAQLIRICQTLGVTMSELIPVPKAKRMK